MDAKIVFYKQKNLTQNEKFKLRRELLGIEQKSNFSKYNYKVAGVLNEIPHYRPVDSTIIVKNEHIGRIEQVLLKYKAEYEIFGIQITEDKLSEK